MEDYDETRRARRVRGQPKYNKEAKLFMGKGSTLSKEKRFTLCVPKDTFDKLSERAKQEQTSVSAVVRKLIIDGLAKA